MTFPWDETVGPRWCIQLLRWMTSPDPRERAELSEAAADYRDRGQLDEREGRTLAWVLAWGAVGEDGWYRPQRDRWSMTVAAVRERLGGPADRDPVRPGFLYSLARLAADDWVPHAALDLVVSALVRTELTSTDEEESYDELVAARSRTGPQVPAEDLPNLPGAAPGDPVGPRVCLDLVRDIADADPAQRRTGAEAAVRRSEAGGFDDDEAATIGTVLAWAIQVEHGDARPALLAALDALAARDRVAPWALEQVLAHLAPAELDEIERPLRQGLAAALAGHRGRAR
jgi:hypothetical protein